MLLLQCLMLRAMLPGELTVKSTVFPPRHRILVRRLMLRLQLLMTGLVLGVQVLMSLLMLALIRVVRGHEWRNREQTRKRNGESEAPEILVHVNLLSLRPS